MDSACYKSKPKKKKVAFFALAFGHDNYLSSHKELLCKEYEILSFAVDGDPGIRRFFRRRSFLTLPVEFIWFVYTLVKFRPDFIISIGPKVGFLATISSFFLPSSIGVHWFTGQVWATAPKKYATKSYWVDWFIKRFANFTLCDGPSQGEFINRELVTQRRTLSISPGSINGIQPRFFDVRRPPLLSQRLRICFIGRKAAGKGLDESVRLAQECERLDLKVSFCLAGPLDETFVDYDKWKSSVLLNTNNLIFLDRLVKPEDIFQESDVLLLLSEREGFNGTVVQAQASGLPVICSNIYGLNDTYIDGVTGFCCPADDLECQVEAIVRLMNDDVYQSMSDAARVFSSMFRSENFSSSLQDIYAVTGLCFSGRLVQSSGDNLRP